MSLLETFLEACNEHPLLLINQCASPVSSSNQDIAMIRSVKPYLQSIGKDAYSASDSDRYLVAMNKLTRDINAFSDINPSRIKERHDYTFQSGMKISYQDQTIGDDPETVSLRLYLPDGKLARYSVHFYDGEAVEIALPSSSPLEKTFVQESIDKLVKDFVDFSAKYNENFDDDENFNYFSKHIV